MSGALKIHTLRRAIVAEVRRQADETGGILYVGESYDDDLLTIDGDVNIALIAHVVVEEMQKGTEQ